MKQKMIAEIAAKRLIEAQLRKQTTFAQQDLFINDRNRFVAAQCGRRAGKTYALAERFIRKMQQYPGSLSRYIALTRDSAKDIMWPVLHEIDEKYDLGAEMAESTLTMKLPNGAKLRLFGADMSNFIRRLKGAKSPAVAIDEAQDFGPHLVSLINDVLTPTIVDYPDSWIALTGTPGPIPRGYFYDVTHSGLYDFSVHKWTILDNPHLPDANKFVEEIKKRNGWDDNSPSFLREYKNQWVMDVDSLLIKYNKDLNHYDTLPNSEWIYVLGVDIGHRDADALAVIGWNEQSQNIYLIEEITTREQDISELTEQINGLYAKYPISKSVIDQGGLGKKIAEELRRRKGIPLVEADKQRKFENVALLNEWLRQGKFKAKTTSLFAQESYQVQIDYEKTTPDRLVVKKGFHSDIIDAVLYAFKESPAWTYREPPAPIKYQSQEWFANEIEKMEEAAEEYFKNQEEWTEEQY